jgi:beta-galactosidase
VKGDIALLVIPEAQAWDYLLNSRHQPETYRHAMWGAYRGFFDNGLQPDWVHIDDVAQYDTIYAPYPIMLTSEHAREIAAWVEKGGTLISEATPGYFGDRGKVGMIQPNHGLDTVFGARESEVEFMPDIGDRIRLTIDGRPVGGGGFLQSYTLAGGEERGRFTDGRLAAVEHRHGKGRTLLVGTHPGIAYFRTSSEENRRYFSDVFAWTGKSPHLRLSNPNLQARLHTNGSDAYVWVLNSTRNAQTALVSFGPQHGAARLGTVLWGAADAVSGNRIILPARDALVIRVG